MLNKIRLVVVIGPFIYGYFQLSRRMKVHSAINALIPSDPFADMYYYAFCTLVLYVLYTFVKMYIRNKFEEVVLLPYWTIQRKFTQLKSWVSDSINARVERSKQQKASSVIENVTNSLASNLLGISACVYSLTRARDWKDVASEAVKLFHLVKFTKDISPSTVVEKLVTTTANGKLPEGVEQSLGLIEQHLTNDIKDCEQQVSLNHAIALSGAALAVTGKEFKFQTDFEPMLHRTAFNIKNMNTVWTEIKGLARSLGLLQGHGYSLLLEISGELSDMKTDLMWIKTTMMSNASELLTVSGRNKIQSLKLRNEEVLKRIALVTDKEIKSAPLYSDCLALQRELSTYVEKADRIKAISNYRAKPVGVCIKGTEQIGKTTLVPWLTKQVGKKLEELSSEFQGAADWYTWGMSPRDEFDSGYFGQEITYSDDAFQDKTNKDHLKWYSFISSTAVGTNQADLKDKDLPYRSRLVVVSCNQYPTTSLTVHHLVSLWERFPITLEVVCKPGQGPPRDGNFSTTFDWLEFYMDTMKGWISEGTRSETRKVTINQVIDRIARQILYEEKFFQSTQSMLRSVETGVQQADEIDPVNLNEQEKRLISGPQRSLLNALLVSDNTEEDQDQPPKVMLETLLKSIAEEAKDKEIALTTIKSKKLDNLVVRFKTTELYRQLYEASLNHFAPTPIKFGTWAACRDLEIYQVSNITMHGAMLVLSEHDYQDRAMQRTNEPFKIYIVNGKKVFWSPLINYGKSLIVITPALEAYLARRGSVPSRFDDLTYLLNDEMVGEFLAQLTVLQSVYRFVAVDNVDYIYSMFKYDYAEDSSRGVMMLKKMITSESTSELTIPQTGLWKNLEAANEKMVTSGLGTLFSVLEFCGLPMNEHWKASLVSKSILVSGPAIGMITGALLYLLYKAIKIKVGEQQSYGEKHPKIKLQSKLSKLKAKPVEQQAIDSVGDMEFLDRLEKPSVPVLADTLTEFIPKGKGALSVCTFLKWMDGVRQAPNGATLYDFDSEVITPNIKNYFQGRKVQIRRGKVHCGGNNEKVSIQVDVKVCCSQDNIEEEILRFVEYIFHAIPHEEYTLDISMHVHSNFVYLYLQHEALNAFERGVSREAITRRNYSDIRNRLLHKLELGDFYVDQDTYIKAVIARDTALAAEQHSVSSNIDFLKSMHISHACSVHVCDINLLDTSSYVASSYAVGHEDYVIFNNHLLLAICNNSLQVVKVRRVNTSDTGYHIAKVIFSDNNRDIAIAKLLSPSDAQMVTEKINGSPVQLRGLSPGLLRFPNIKQKLLTQEQIALICNGITTLHYLPKTDTFVTGHTVGRNSSPIRMGDIIENRDLCEVIVAGDSVLSQNISQKGDCGGLVVVAEGKQQQKIIGFHSLILKGEDKWCIAFVTKNDLDMIETNHGMAVQQFEMSNKDPFINFINYGEPATEMPVGPCVKPVGKYVVKTTAATNVDLNHWRPSPFFNQFEEQLQPGPLSPFDERINVDYLAKNVSGKPSLLATAQQDIAKEITEPDSDLLAWIEEQLTKEYQLKLSGLLKPVPNDIDEVLTLALNGHPSNKYVTGIEVNAAAGLPWSHKGFHKKCDLIDVDEETGHRSFKPVGQELKNRLTEKLTKGRQGIRLLSFINSKLKDTCIKRDYVEIGKTRVFECVPIDVILFESALYGNFKEAYTSAGLELHHAVGINPHSMDWTELARHLLKHPNHFDADYKNYDKVLHKTVLKTISNLKRKVIQKLCPDSWDKAREVLNEELTEAYMVVLDSVFQTERGNKSGRFETTVDNCIANDIYGIYTWCKVTGIRDLSLFRDNVAEVSFGDDKCSAVSDAFADQYNFITYKRELEKLGHTITDGTKSSEENKFTTFDKLIFLKRNFVQRDQVFVAPILKRSLEAPFVWTTLLPSQHAIWYELIRAQMAEAYLHGEQYYNSFMNCLSNCEDKDLKKHIVNLLLRSYEGEECYYWKQYYGFVSRSVGARHDAC